MRNDLPVPPTPVKNMVQGFQIGALTCTGLVPLLMTEVLLHQPIDMSLVLVCHRHTLGQIDLVGSAVLQIAHIVHGRLRFSLLHLGPIVTTSVTFDVDMWWLVFLSSLVDFLHLITSCQYLLQLVMLEVETIARLKVPLECLFGCLVWPEEVGLSAERHKQEQQGVKVVLPLSLLLWG